MNTLIKAILAAGALALAATASLPAYSAEATLDQAIATARTPAEHEALAGRYESEAKDVQAKVEEHKKMSAAYRGMGRGGAASFVAHCDKLTLAYQQVAKQNGELARLHHRMAAEARK